MKKTAKRITTVIMSLLLAVNMLPLMSVSGIGSYAKRVEPLEIRGAGDMGVLYKGYSQEEADSIARTISVTNNFPEDEEVQISCYSNSMDIELTGPDTRTIGSGETVDFAVVRPKTGMPVGEWDGEIYVHSDRYFTNQNMKFSVVNDGLSMFCGYWPNNSLTDDDDILLIGRSVEGAEPADAEYMYVGFDLVNNGSESFTFSFSSDSDLFMMRCSDENDEDMLLRETDLIGVRATVDPAAARKKKAGVHYGTLTVTATSTKGNKITADIRVRFDILPAPELIEPDPLDVSTEHMHSSGAIIPLYHTGDGLIPYDDHEKYIRFVLDGSGLILDDLRYPNVRLDSSVTETGRYEGTVSLYYDPTGTGSFPDEPTSSTDVCIEVWDSNDYRFAVYCGNTLLETDNHTVHVDLGTLYEGYSAADAKKLQKQIRLKNTGNAALEFSTDSMITADHNKNFVFSSGSGWEEVAPGGVYNKLSVMPAAGLPAGKYSCRAEFEEKSRRATKYKIKSVVFTVNVVRKGIDFEARYKWKDIPEGGIDHGTLYSGASTYGWIEIRNRGEHRIRLTAESDKSFLKIMDNISGSVLGISDAREIDYVVDTAGLEQGRHTAKLTVKAVSEDDSSVVKEIVIPVSFRVDDSVADVTVDLQGVGRLENIVRRDVPVSRLTIDVAREMIWGNSDKTPVAEGYIILNLTGYPDSHYRSWDDYYEESVKSDKYEKLHVYDVQTLYLNWAKEIKTESITVKAPPCGAAGDALPKVSIPGGSHYHIAEVEYYDENGKRAEKLEYGKKYKTSITLESDWGYGFSNSGLIPVNGKDTYCYTGYYRNRLSFTIDPLLIEDHDWDGGRVTVQATASKTGVKTYSCKKCKASKTEDIPKLSGESGSGQSPAGGGSAPAASEGSGTAVIPSQGPAEIRDLPSVKIAKPKAAKKSVTVKWKKISKKNLKKIKKVEIQCSTDPGFTADVKKAYSSAKKTSKKVRGLQKGQKYYLRVRAYTAGGDGLHVSGWSSVRSFRAK